jgi:hypothetical protein
MFDMLLQAGVDSSSIQIVISGQDHSILPLTKVVLTHHTYFIYKPFSHTPYEIVTSIFEQDNNNTVIWLDEADEYYNKAQVNISFGAYYRRYAGSEYFRCDRSDLFSSYVKSANRVGIRDGVPFFEAPMVLPSINSIELGSSHMSISIADIVAKSYRGYTSEKLLLKYTNIEKVKDPITPIDWNFNSNEIDIKVVKKNILTYIRDIPKSHESVSVVEKMVKACGECHKFVELHKEFSEWSTKEKEDFRQDLEIPYYAPEPILQGIDLRVLKSIRDKGIQFIETSATFSSVSIEAMNTVFGESAIIDEVKEPEGYWNSKVSIYHTTSDFNLSHKMSTKLVKHFEGARDTDKAIDIFHFIIPSMKKLIFTSVKKKTLSIDSKYCLRHKEDKDYKGAYNDLSIDLTYCNSTVGRGSNIFANSDIVIVPLKVVKPPFAFFGESEDRVIQAAQNDAKNVAVQNVGRIIRKDSRPKEKIIIFYGVEGVLLDSTLQVLKNISNDVHIKELVYKKESDQEIIVDLCNKISGANIKVDFKYTDRKSVNWATKYSDKIGELLKEDLSIAMIKSKLNFNKLSEEKQKLIEEIINKFKSNNIKETVCKL